MSSCCPRIISETGLNHKLAWIPSPKRCTFPMIRTNNVAWVANCSKIYKFKKPLFRTCQGWLFSIVIFGMGYETCSPTFQPGLNIGYLYRMRFGAAKSSIVIPLTPFSFDEMAGYSPVEHIFEFLSDGIFTIDKEIKYI